MSYLIATFVLFVVWPVNWNIYGAEEWTTLTAYVALCFAALAIGFVFGRRGRPRRTKLSNWKPIFIAGALLSVLLLVPLTELETGRDITELAAAFGDQKDAYLRFQAQINSGAASSVVISLASAVAAPFIFAVAPLAVLRWGTLPWSFRILAGVAIFCSLALSTMRGTDREVANVFIVLTSSMLVAAVRAYRKSAGKVGILRRFWKPGLVVIVLVIAGATITTSRKEGRLGGTEKACIGATGMCADLNAPSLSWMGERQRFGASIFILSTTQGYYGLDLGLQKDFRSTFGIGHSPAIASLYTKLSGDTLLQQNAYTFRNSFDGWSDQNFWSTMVLWIANDVGFGPAIGVIGLLAVLWGRSWRDATDGFNDVAAIFFCQMMEMITYFPANNQIFMVFDSYFTFLFWLFAWVYFGEKAKVSRGVTTHKFVDAVRR